MKDPRNIERGACKKEDCDCTAYSLDEKATSAACSYCQCPPTAHVAEKGQIITSTPTTSNDILTTPNSSLTEASKTINSSTSASEASDIVTLSVHNVSDPFLQSLLVQQSSDEPNTDEIFLPVKLPRKCETALANRDVDHRVKSSIVREVVSNLMGHDQTSTKCLQKAAKKMVNKWSPLKDHNDPDNNGLLTMLRKRRDRCNKTDNVSASTSSRGNIHQLTALEAKKEMFDKWSANLRTAAAHKHLMEVARPLRKVEAKKLPGLQLLKSFPALGINEVLLQELLAELETTEDEARDKWRRTMEPLKKYHQTEKKFPFVEGTLDEETLWILESIHLYNIWFKEVNRQNTDDLTKERKSTF
ncbi:uncharacterized protein LOC127751068 [Frankliniella occidentalis]|uniref:Uncharacterized protein LOC127751068 n=1 Tax=Frankliniella occidentalis TaxID=133901 RepID=A0A9C6XSV2_FRAOC|nr:uncharacterized protein LOC127751068 [Frankliniella occidentalis]